MPKHEKKYVGLTHEIRGGMTPIGKAIRDAWVFDLIPEEETCEGWHYDAINALIQQVNQEWDKHGCLVSQLPPPLLARHQRIHDNAIQQAINAGWSGEDEIRDDD
ncbi:MAG TPA: hypothetical protein DD979_04325 [Gammaproteobacteria bacterium]|nr:hypothetical protein [Gammaproteobacteria bacterium]